MGASFDHMAEEYSACASSQQQGFAGYHSLDQLPEALVSALTAGTDHQNSTDNAISPEAVQQQTASATPYLGPIKTHLGYHILRPAEDLKRPVINDLSPES